LNMPGPPLRLVSGDPVAWLLNTCAVHPLRYREAVEALAGRVEDPVGLIEGAGEGEPVVEDGVWRDNVPC